MTFSQPLPKFVPEWRINKPPQIIEGLPGLLRAVADAQAVLYGCKASVATERGRAVVRTMDALAEIVAGFVRSNIVGKVADNDE